MLGGIVEYSDTMGKSGVLPPGSVEGMNAGSGAWHDSRPVGTENVMGYQLWIALPPDRELMPPMSQYLAPNEISTLASARIILGQYAGAKSGIHSPDGINYLHVKIHSGEKWRYETPSGHTVGWVFAHKGTLLVSDQRLHQELTIFEESDGALEFEAEGPYVSPERDLPSRGAADARGAYFSKPNTHRADRIPI